MNALPENYTIKPFDLNDALSVVEMLNLASRELVGVEEENLQDDLTAWTNEGFNVAEDARVVLSPEGKIAGYGEHWDIIEPHVHMNAFIRVHPEHKNKGIGTYLTSWTEKRARERMLHAAPNARVSILHRYHTEDIAATALLEKMEYQLLRFFFEMQIEMDLAPEVSRIPPGLTIRSMQPGQERLYIATVQDSFRDHWGFLDEPFETYFTRWMHFLQGSDHHAPDLWFGAWDGDQLAGVCLCRATGPIDPAVAWVSQLGVRRAWRKCGLGLHLLQYAFAEFYRRGLKRVGLTVDAGSLTGALKLYERAGMHLVRQYNTYEKELRPGIELATTSLARD